MKRIPTTERKTIYNGRYWRLRYALDLYESKKINDIEFINLIRIIYGSIGLLDCKKIMEQCKAIIEKKNEDRKG